MAELKNEWSAEVSFSLMLLVVLLSPLLYDVFQRGTP